MFLFFLFVGQNPRCLPWAVEKGSWILPRTETAKCLKPSFWPLSPCLLKEPVEKLYKGMEHLSTVHCLYLWVETYFSKRLFSPKMALTRCWGNVQSWTMLWWNKSCNHRGIFSHRRQEFCKSNPEISLLHKRGTQQPSDKDTWAARLWYTLAQWLKYPFTISILFPKA